jgi:hypothetical protein
LLATDDGPGALLASDVEVAGDPLELLLEDQRADLSVGVDAVADVEALAEISNATDEFVIDFLLVPEARRQGPALASHIGVEIEACDLLTRPLSARRGAGERVLAAKEGGSGAQA